MKDLLLLPMLVAIGNIGSQNSEKSGLADVFVDLSTSLT